MAKIILICGMICSGKSTLAERLARTEGAVVLSCDALTKVIGDDLGERHDAIASRIQIYLRNMAVELARLGVNVILEWGFWRAADRLEMRRFLAECGVTQEWHYINVSQDQLARNIRRRNAAPGPSDYIVDDGLLHKCLDAFQPPATGEMDAVHVSSNC